MRRTDIRRSRAAIRGFTLIEMMVVLAIVAVLAAVAIPNFLRFQLKSKSAEARVNLNAIRTIEEARYAETGAYVSASAAPAVLPGADRVPFTSTSFDELGWRPSGDVYFSYAVTLTADGTGYLAEAAADLDDDGTAQNWGYSKSDDGGIPASSALGCAVAGLAEAALGPCDPEHGQSIF